MLEERRGSRGAQGRLLDQLIQAALPGSKYGQRLPIGTEESLKTAKPEQIRRFYTDWYRPDLMAVIVVGDFDPAAMEKAVVARFGDLRGPANPKPRPHDAVPAHARPVALSLKDPELPFTVVAVAAKRPRRKLETERDYRQSLVDSLFSVMLNHRLDELKQKPDAPFLQAFVGKEPILRPIDIWFQGALVKGEMAEQALEVMSAEVARVGAFGFTDTEIERARKEVLRKVQDAAREADKTESRSYAEEITKYFLTGDGMPGIQAELALVEKLLPTIKADEIKAVAGEVAREDSRVFIAAANTRTTLPDEAGLLAAAAYVDQGAAGPLLDAEPRAGTIKKERVIEPLGVTEWTLSNGVTVVLKPTDFKNDQILLNGFAPGGHSLARDAQWVSAAAAAEIAEVSGAGKHSAGQLGKALAGTSVRVDLGLEELQERVQASASPDDLKTMLELVHLKMTAPRRDEEAFAAWKGQIISALRDQMADPGVQFQRRFVDELYKKHPRRRMLVAEDFEKLDLDQALAFQKQRFADLSDFTFVMVGNFDVAAVKPLVLSYLGGLPGKKKKEKWRDVKVSLPKGQVRFEVKKGIEPKAEVRLVYHGDLKWTREAEHELHSLAHLVGIRLREELREGMGGTYGVHVQGEFERRPASRYELTIDFGCAPENVDKLVAAALAEIEVLKTKGPSTENVDKVMTAQRREREVQLKDNGFWTYALTSPWWYGTDPRRLLEFDKLVARLSPAVLQGAAKRYFGKDSVLGVLKPEK